MNSICTAQMPQWLVNFANVSLPEWVDNITHTWFPNNSVSFLMLAIMLKCCLISVYCAVIYFGIWLFKRIRGRKMRIRTRYYSWYALVFSIPLSGLGFNNAIKLPFYDIFLGSFSMEFYELNAISDIELAAILNLTKIVGLLRPILFCLTAIWLIITAWKCLRQISLNIKLKQQIKKQDIFIDPDNLMQKAAAAFGIHTDKIQVIPADFILSPVSYGVFKKVILLPHDYSTRYTTSELYLLLLHEMGHIKNHDTVKIQLLSIAECFIWTLRPMRKGFIRDSEILCDNRVLGVNKNNRDTYGELLVQECSKNTLVKGIGFSDSFHTLKVRVETIYSHKPEKHQLAAFAVVIVLFLAGYIIYASQVPASWLAVSQAENELDDLQILYLDGENGERISESVFLLTNSSVLNSGEVLVDTDNLEIRQMYSYDEGKLRVDCYALYQYLLPYLENGLQATGVCFKMHGEYGMNTVRDALLWNGTSGSGSEFYRTCEIDINDLTQATPTDRYKTFSCQANADERVYQFIAHWL